MKTYTINEIALARLKGWKASEWVYVSTIGQLRALGDVLYVYPVESYSAIHGMSVMILCSESNPTQAYEIADKVIQAGALNVAVWVVQWSQIVELVSFGHRFQTPKGLPMSCELKAMVTELSEGLAA